MEILIPFLRFSTDQKCELSDVLNHSYVLRQVGAPNRPDKGYINSSEAEYWESASLKITSVIN